MVVWRVAILVAALAAGSAASAKDRPPPKRDEPRDLTGCEFFGEGYVKAPGTDTCIKLSGSVRTEGAAMFRR
jgi:Porin subfamily